MKMEPERFSSTQKEERDGIMNPESAVGLYGEYNPGERSK